MKTIEASGKIEKGKLEIYNKEVFHQAIQDIGFVNHAHITVAYGNKRTLSQNNYLFGGIVEPIRLRLEQDGYQFTNYECYKWLENRFCETVKHNEQTGTKYRTIKPIKELSTEEFEKIVMNKIRMWAINNLGINIKLPHEYYEMTLDAYNRWKQGEINKTEAIKISQGKPLKADP